VIILGALGLLAYLAWAVWSFKACFDWDNGGTAGLLLWLSCLIMPVAIMIQIIVWQP